MEDKGNGTREFLKSVVLTEILKCSTFTEWNGHMFGKRVYETVKDDTRYKIIFHDDHREIESILAQNKQKEHTYFD